MGMLVDQERALKDFAPAQTSSVNTIEELAAALKEMTFSKNITYKGWTVEKGGLCDAPTENGEVTRSNKIWVTDRRSDRAYKVSGCCDRAAHEIAALIGLEAGVPE